MGAAIKSLSCETLPVPAPAAGQVRVKVQYAAVNPIDWKLMSGGLDGVCPCSFPYTPGFDISGVVDAVGDDVSDLAAGDAVVADLGLVETCCNPPPAAGCGGAFAEFAVLPAGLCAKRGGMAADAAAGLPLAGLTTYQALFTGEGSSFAGERLGDLKAGQKLLILGGSSATGAFAVQLAKNAGATVAATASENLMPDGTTKKIDFVKSLGADQVIDYKSADWAEVLAGQEYDLIFDTVGLDEDLAKADKVLKKGGDFVSIANFNPESKSTDEVRFAVFLIKSTGAELSKLVQLADEGKLQVPVDSTVAFEDVPAALEKNMSFRSGGKIVVKVSA